MASLMTKIHRAVSRRTPLTIRREYDYDAFRHYFAVRANTERSPLELLGKASTAKRDEILRMCRENGFRIDELVPDKSWICRP